MEAQLFNNLLVDNFLKEKELHNGPKGVVSLLREKQTGKRHVYHEFRGSAEAYEALLGVESSYLPHIEQVVCRGETVQVLEEYIQGDTLSFLLEECPLSETQAREILIQICRGLKVLHSLGIVHRDVKPDNVILRGDEAVLIDFDVSRVCKTERDSDTRVMGTAGYAAPEQFGFLQTDARADIFALGVMLNEMLTRRHPSQKLADGPMRHIIEKCIEVNVDKRYASVDELLEALHAPPPRKNRQWKRWLMPVLISLVAVGLLHVILFVVKPSAGTLPAAEGPVSTPPAVKPTFSADPLPTPSAEPTPEGSKQPQEVPRLCRKLPWHGDLDVYGTEFRCDLNGDGADEVYLFAAMFDFAGEPRLLQHSGAAVNDGPEVMSVAGAVWKKTGEAQYEPVDVFAPMLTDCTVTVRQIEGEQPGAVEEIGALYGLWPGAIQATYHSVGYWYYECSAVLHGETLTAVGATRTERVEETPPQTTKPSTVDSAPLLPMIRTDGKPIGTPFPLEFDLRDELKEGTCEFYSFTAQRLDNGIVRFTLDYCAPKLRSITAFDPPDGALFRYYDRSGTSGERELLVFDILEEQLREAGQFTITFSSEAGGRFLVFVSPDALKSILEPAHRYA